MEENQTPADPPGADSAVPSGVDMESETRASVEPSGQSENRESTKPSSGESGNQTSAQPSSAAVEEAETEIARNLYTEIVTMMYASNFINTIVRFRRDKRVKGSELTDPDFLMSLPKKSPEVVEWMKNNYKALKEPTVQEKFDLEGLEILSKLEATNDESSLEVLDDEFAFGGLKADVVYGMTRNPAKKRITVVFRGTFQQKDWIQDMKALSKDIKIDMHRMEAINANSDLVELGGPNVHSGFTEYLVRERKTDGKSKLDDILDQVMTCMKDPSNEGFSLYITGHSLGAALATLLATVCAVSDDTPKPVKLFTFASPHVGKESFVEVHEKLSRSGRLQHIRTTNNDDLTPQGLGGLGYRHVGVHLNLYRNAKKGQEPYSISSSKVKGFWDVWSNHMTVTPRWMLGKYGLDMHQLYEHNRRLEKCKSGLKALTLDELYQDPDLMGFDPGER